ncbi:Cell growth-regulating nucleolar protein [Apodemus speciosus]|uniref:Cell growth-regulating nucleolar protein n=1 Tax=Apodemus speciosus TaxID=105296 RepID=A0ABQ0ERU3_APOSI
MVFFTCNACGESVKKVQVEKHVSVCRNCECLSCIDCGKDFWGDDYKNHVKCISEGQKYGGKGYEAKTHKGDAKQQAWIQKINELIKKPNVSPKVRELLQQISAFDNVPRKKAKFQNWMRNSLKVHSDSVLEQVWNIFSEASSSVPSAKTNGTTEEQTEAKKNKRERKEERQKNRKKEKKELKLENHQENPKSQKPKKRKKGQEAGHEAGGEDAAQASGPAEKKKARGGQAPEEGADRNGGPGEDAEEGQTKAAAGKRKRQKHSEVESDSKKKKMKLPEQPEEESPGTMRLRRKGKFNWKGTIKAVLKQAPDNEISVKKLKKKVIAQYHAVMSDHHTSEEELLAIFNRKISRNPTFKVLKDRVKLLK